MTFSIDETKNPLTSKRSSKSFKRTIRSQMFSHVEAFKKTFFFRFLNSQEVIHSSLTVYSAWQ